MKYAFVLTMLLPAVALADGGVVRARQTQGKFIVTIFTPPESSTAGPTEVTVMVQRSDTEEVVMDAAVDLSFLPPAGASIQPDKEPCGGPGMINLPAGPAPSVRATRAQAANKLLYGASVVLPAVGDWQLRALVREGNDQVTITCNIPIGAPARRIAVLWPVLALPPLAIALFAINQWIRTRTVVGGTPL